MMENLVEPLPLPHNGRVVVVICHSQVGVAVPFDPPMVFPLLLPPLLFVFLSAEEALMSMVVVISLVVFILCFWYRMRCVDACGSL